MATTSRLGGGRAIDTEAVVAAFLDSDSDLSSVPSQFDEHAAQDRVGFYRSKGDTDYTKKILSSFLKFLPSDGREMLATFIMSNDDDDVLESISQHLMTAILEPMKARTVTRDITPSPFHDNEDSLNQISSTMDESSTRHSQQKLKKDCLERDNFRCMATGIFDISHEPEGDLDCGKTNLCHILPFTIGEWGNNRENHRIAQVWATLMKCFPKINIDPSHINDTTNLMTLWEAVHTEFGEFRLIFEPTSTQNQYKISTLGRGNRAFIRSSLPRQNENGDRIITFQNHINDNGHNNAELPSPVLLQTHAALARILHASGMAEHIDEVLRERDMIRGLKSDGSTNISRLLFAF